MDSQETSSTSVPPARETSGMAIASLILSILGISVVGLILGIIAKKKINQSSGRLGGRGMATAGIIVSSVMLVGQCLILLPVIMLTSSNFSEATNNAKVMTTRATITTLHGAVNMFRLDMGRFPDKDAGLLELIKQPTDVKDWNTGGYLECTEVPRDAWGNEFVYKLNPESGKPFVIISYGADGMEGGVGNNADIYSTEIY